MKPFPPGEEGGAVPNPYRQRLVSYIQTYKSALAVVVSREERTQKVPNPKRTPKHPQLAPQLTPPPGM